MVKSESAISIAAVCLGIVGKHLARAAKVLVVSKPIAIFHPRDRKS